MATSRWDGPLGWATGTLAGSGGCGLMAPAGLPGIRRSTLRIAVARYQRRAVARRNADKDTTDHTSGRHHWRPAEETEVRFPAWCLRRNSLKLTLLRVSSRNGPDQLAALASGGVGAASLARSVEFTATGRAKAAYSGRQTGSHGDSFRRRMASAICNVVAPVMTPMSASPSSHQRQNRLVRRIATITDRSASGSQRRQRRGRRA